MNCQMTYISCRNKKMNCQTTYNDCQNKNIDFWNEGKEVFSHELYPSINLQR
jgi:hypothetical protein